MGKKTLHIFLGEVINYPSTVYHYQGYTTLEYVIIIHIAMTQFTISRYFKHLAIEFLPQTSSPQTFSLHDQYRQFC